MAPAGFFFTKETKNLRKTYAGGPVIISVDYDDRKVPAMIELTEQQMRALEKREAAPPQVVHPQTREMFVLVRADEYKRLKENEYDDSPWTKDELHAAAWEVGKQVGWENMDEYDDLPERA